MDSYDIIAEAVKGYWKDEYPQDVVVFFQQKYSWDDEWERYEELVECHGFDDYENMTFHSDFCEGQTEVKDVVVVPLCEVLMFYSSMQIKLKDSVDRPLSNVELLRSLPLESLAEWLANELSDSTPVDWLAWLTEVNRL